MDRNVLIGTVSDMRDTLFNCRARPGTRPLRPFEGTSLPLLEARFHFRAHRRRARYTADVTGSRILACALAWSSLCGVQKIAHAEPRAALAVVEDASGRFPPHVSLGAVERAALPWSAAAAPATAHADTRDGALSITLTAARDDGEAGEKLAIEASWKKRAWVHELAVELELDADAATVVGRDLNPVKLGAGRIVWLERFDPKWITLLRAGRPLATVAVDDSVDAVQVRVGAHAVTLRIGLDSADARPFVHDARCTTNWRAPNQHLPSPLRLRLPDEKVIARLRIYPASSAAPLTLAKSHFPDGRRAALAWTDHADQSSARTLEALVHGFLAHHLAITKALFAHGSDRPQLEDPKVAQLADELAEAGSEVVPHSATPKPDLRNVTQAALERFERWHARTWIDHQPETNCEAFGDQGFHVGGKFGIADLLAAHAYQYVWAEDDAPPDDLNLLAPRHLDRRAPTVWPIGRLELGGPDGLWMFRTVWAFLEASRFYRLYSPERLDRLEAERGLHVAHTYLETYHPKRTRFGLKNLLVPAEANQLPGGPGAVKLDARFDALLAGLEERQARGTLWVPTLRELADRLRAIADVSVTLTADGSARLHTPREVPGATFVVDADVDIEIGGHAPKGERTEGRQTLFWDDLPAGETIVKLSRAGTPVPFAEPAPPPQAQRDPHE
jgi:hypothetical protein